MRKSKRSAWEKKVRRISHTRKPEGLSLEEWQVLLRRQITKDELLRIKRTGPHPVFSTFEVTNPKTGKIYRVVIRGEKPGINYCSCPDFSVNTLGTCKHIESVLAKLRKKDGISKILSAGYVSDHSSVTLRYGLQRRAAFSLGRSTGSGLKMLVHRFFDPDLFLTPWGFQHFDQFVREASVLKDDIRYHEDAMAFIANVRDMAVREKRVRKMFPKGVENSKWNTLLKTTLYPYQRTGALFAVSAGRCMIADDMGLGKTIQAIAASEIMARSLGVEKVLIVCPTSLKHQWKQEIEKLTNQSVEIIQGALEVRHSRYQTKSFFKITNYDVIHRDLVVIEKWSPDLVILDEAQRIKNWKTRLARSVKKISSPYALVLTGTPLENRLEELHSILEFIDQHHLGPLFRFLDRHQIADETGKVVGYRDLHELGKTLETILIRRTRKQVLPELPERMVKNHFVSMTKEQMEIHEENRELVARIVQKWRRYHFLSEEDQMRLTCALQNMRMVCDDTYLIDGKSIHGKKVDELELQIREIFENPKAKAVIFSQWVRMQELVQAMLNVNNWQCVCLNGSVPAEKRGELIRMFKENPECRVFLSTDAGGVGLNLQNAATVINLDLPWNPAVLEQRIGRVHRLGQEQAVRVINFVAEGTIESGMLELIKFKQSMFSGVLDGGSNEVFMGESRLNRFMKTVATATGAIGRESEASDQRESTEDQKTAQEEISEEIYQKEQENFNSVTRSPSLNVNVLKELFQAGSSLLAQLSERFNDCAAAHGKAATPVKMFPGIKINTEPETGRKTLQIDLPDEKTLEQIAETAHVLLGLFKK